MTLGTESHIDPPVVKDLLVRAVSSVLNHNIAVFVLPLKILDVLNLSCYFPMKVYGPLRFGKH